MIIVLTNTVIESMKAVLESKGDKETKKDEEEPEIIENNALARGEYDTEYRSCQYLVLMLDGFFACLFVCFNMEAQAAMPNCPLTNS